jgi:competence ComEA-like helix-hairpin-helix protein
MRANEYFTFTKRERTGIVALMMILLLIIVLSQIYPRKEPTPNQLITAEVDTVKPVDVLPGKKVPYRYTRPVITQPPPRKRSHKAMSPVDINTADTSAFIALPGIGSKLAARIVAFREKLGGFYDVRQVGEVYGLQDSVLQKLLPLLKCDDQLVKKIKINNAGKDELKTHPYIRWELADVLIAFRNAHGSFSSAEDLSKIDMIDDDMLNRIMPYISFN